MEILDDILESIISAIPTIVTYFSLLLIFVPASKGYFYNLLLSSKDLIYKVICYTGQHSIRSATTLVSLKLSPIEQAAFEEQFKYLIVASTLLSDAQVTSQPQIDLEKTIEQAGAYSSRHIKFGLIAFFSIMGLCVMTLPSTNSQQELAIQLLSTTFIISCYFVYRYEKHQYARKIHAAALESMQKFISLSQESDTHISQLIDYFTNKDDTTAELPLFKSKLKALCESYISFVEQLKPLTDLNEIVCLRKMYNIREDIPSSILDSLEQGDLINTELLNNDDIKVVYSVICFMRRQYLIYFMGMGVMSKNHSTHYGENWEYAIKINNALVHECDGLNKELLDISSSLACDTSLERQNSFDVTSDARIIGLTHRLLAFEKHMKDIQAHLYLSKQDAKVLSNGRAKSHPLEKIALRFNKIDDLIPQLLDQWQEGKAAFKVLCEQSKLNMNSPLPSPPTSPTSIRYTSSPELSHSLPASPRYTSSPELMQSFLDSQKQSSQNAA